MAIHTFVYPPAPPSTLPSGAATAAKQDTGNASLASIDGKITAVNTGAVVVSSSALPTGAATSAKQDTGNTSLASIDGKITAVNTGAVVVSSSALPSGAATSAKQDTGNTSVASIDSKTPALGQALAAASVPVVLTAAQISTLTPLTSVAVTNAGTFATQAAQSGTWNITNVSGTVSLPTGAATSAKQDTGNTSLASIDTKLTSPLTVNATLSAETTKVIGTVNVAAAQTIAVTNAGTFATQAAQSGTWNVTNVSGTVSLPTGASTAANQSTIITDLGAVTETAPATDTASSGLNGRLQRIAQRLTSLIAQFPTSLGQTTKAASLSVAVASDQTLSISGISRSKANAPVRNDYSSVNVTTGAYVQLVASTTSATTKVSIFDSSGQTLVLAVGAAASEIDQFNIFPGGNGDVEIAIPASSRVSIKAVSATASVGEINVNFFT